MPRPNLDHIMNLRIVQALVLRQIFVNLRTPLRFVEMLFWPIVDMVLWGFLTVYLRNTVPPEMKASVSFLLGGVILWDILFRCQQGVTISFLEDVWRRNLLNVFVAPVSMFDYIASTFCVGFIRICITGTVMFFATWIGYQFNMITEMQLWLVPFFMNVVFFGWILGLITTALLFRLGHAAEVLAWAVPFLIQPLAAVFYPLSVLPVWLQYLAQALPVSHVFESMRTVIAGQQPDVNRLLIAFGLNLFYMILAGLFFARMLKSVREMGLLAKPAAN